MLILASKLFQKNFFNTLLIYLIKENLGFVCQCFSQLILQRMEIFIARMHRERVFL